MRTLIALTSCHAYRDRADSIRETWAQEIGEHADFRVFLGRGEAKRPDEVLLDCPDGYHYLSAKTQLIRRWALANGYEFVWKVDDDCYLRPERLFANGLSNHDYVGRLRGPSGNYANPYCSGFCYGLSKKAMELLAPLEWDASDDFSEDRWTGNKLMSLGISPYNATQFIVEYSKNNAVSGREPPLAGNPVIAACEYRPDLMRRVHEQFKSGKQSQMGRFIRPEGSLSRVAVMIKTFLRDGFLFRCLEGLEKNFPESKIVVVDDGWESGKGAPFNKISKSAEMRAKQHAWINLPFDSGFGAKANAAIPECMKKEYVLIGSDDFDFNDPAVRAGVEAMQKVLDAVPSLGLVSGRVDSNPYEFVWEPFERGLREVPKYHGTGHVNGSTYHLCDLTVNYSLIRTKIFDPQFGGIRWDGGAVKIGGGEHSAFFIDLQRSYWSVAYVEGANINQMKFSPFEKAQRQHKGYDEMRARARKPGRPCLKERGIDTYVLGDGTVEVS
jgi:hypothetical protein